MRRRMGLYFLSSMRSGVFLRFLVVTYREVPGMPDVLCSVHSRMTCTRLPFFAIAFRLGGAKLRLFLQIQRRTSVIFCVVDYKKGRKCSGLFRSHLIVLLHKHYTCFPSMSAIGAAYHVHARFCLAQIPFYLAQFGGAIGISRLNQTAHGVSQFKQCIS